MIRTRHIVDKCGIFKFIEDPKISKIEILSSAQKTLKDPSVRSVYVYHRVNWNLMCSVLGNCKIAAIHFLEHRPFLNGILSSKSVGFISASNIKELFNIQRETGFNFGIPDEVKQICKTQYPEIDQWIPKAGELFTVYGYGEARRCQTSGKETITCTQLNGRPGGTVRFDMIKPASKEEIERYSKLQYGDWTKVPESDIWPFKYAIFLGNIKGVVGMHTRPACSFDESEITNEEWIIRVKNMANRKNSNQIST